MEHTDTRALKTLKPVWMGSLYYMFTFLVAGSYAPFLNVYFTGLGLNGEQIGLLSILAPMMMLLFSTGIASLADRLHQRARIAQVALAGAAVAMFFLRLPTTFLGIAAIVLLQAIFTSPVMALSDSLIARMAQRHDLDYGGMRLWGSFAFAVASVAFGACWSVFGYQPMFITTTVMYLPLIWITGRLEEGPVIAVENRQPIAHLFRDQGTIVLMVATFLSGISNSLFMIFGGVYANSLGGSNLLIGFMIAFGALAELPMMFYSQKIAHHLNKINTILLSYGLMAAGYLGYVLMTEPNYLPIFSITKGLGYGLWFTVTVRLLVERTPEEWAATAQSLLSICWFGLSPLVAGPLGGLIHDAINPGAVFLLGILTLGMAAIVLWLGRNLLKR